MFAQLANLCHNIRKAEEDQMIIEMEERQNPPNPRDVVIHTIGVPKIRSSVWEVQAKKDALSSSTEMKNRSWIGFTVGAGSWMLEGIGTVLVVGGAVYESANSFYTGCALFAVGWLAERITVIAEDAFER